MGERILSAGAPQADVCLVLEGTYPFVPGGVSVWVHELLRAQSHLRFHILAIRARATQSRLHFALPPNVVGLTEVALHRGFEECDDPDASVELLERIATPLETLLNAGGLADLERIVRVVHGAGRRVRVADILNSRAAWPTLVRALSRTMPEASLVDYFWSWRSLVGSIFAVLLAPLVRARCYHSASTGYAGLYLARAVLETGRPGVTTEHGIYTNERRIEITGAQWLPADRAQTYRVVGRRRGLRELWTDAFVGLSRCCYEASSEIVTLYADNQAMQRADGAPAGRLRVIPNGVDAVALATLPREASRPIATVALIGRVVPIKDVQTFVRAIAHLRGMLPALEAYVLGGMDEDPEYALRCRELAVRLRLEGVLRFMGQVPLREWLPRIDVLALTSLSEAQPLVLLEAGASGIPCVATDVGCCREILYGPPGEDPAFGPGGTITSLANPLETAHALALLLRDEARRRQKGRNLQRRVLHRYEKSGIDAQYRVLYETLVRAPDGGAPPRAPAVVPDCREPA